MEITKDVKYWNDRYYNGGHSGSGSKGNLLKWKAEIINAFIEEKEIKTVVDLGCGDGNLSQLLKGTYHGVDISTIAIKIAKGKRKGKYYTTPPDEVFDLAISADVIFHITDKQALKEHLSYLKKHKYFIIYSPKEIETKVDHVRSWDWLKMLRRKPLRTIKQKYPVSQFGTSRGSYSEFYIYKGC